MKNTLKLFLLCLASAAWLQACQIANVDYFVPEIKIADETQSSINVPAAGGTYSVGVSSNCEWTAECPADWVTVTPSSGKKDATISIVVSSARIARNTAITVFSDEVTDRFIEIQISQEGVKELTSVSEVSASNLESSTGKTASLSAGFESLGLEESDNVSGSFKLSAAGSDTTITANVNTEAGIISAEVTFLKPAVQYTVVASVKLNDDEPVVGPSATFSTVKLACEITSVEKAGASNLSTTDGTTATLSSSFTTSLPLSATDSVLTGFSISAQGVSEYDVEAVVDKATMTFEADLTGLTPSTEYIAIAWAKLGEDVKVLADSIHFKTSKEESLSSITVIGDFTTNTLWNLPTSITAPYTSEISVKDSTYTWKFFGAAFVDDCLWLATTAKETIDGYVILPCLTGRKVSKISFPNDGPSPSGKARITLSRSTDGGKTFTDMEGFIDVSCGDSNLTDQPKSAIYKITNVKISKGGHSKTTKITIVTE